MPKKIDKELGLNKAITRRDFVYGSSLIMGATYTGCLLYTSPSPRD